MKEYTKIHAVDGILDVMKQAPAAAHHPAAAATNPRLREFAPGVGRMIILQSLIRNSTIVEERSALSQSTLLVCNIYYRILPARVLQLALSKARAGDPMTSGLGRGAL